MKDLSYQTIFQRTFLLENLPESLNKSSEHLQILDNFIEVTRMNLQKIRSPKENKFTYFLEQKFPLNDSDLSICNYSKMLLNESEYQIFKRLETNELRFNRYFYKYQSKQIEIDVYLGKELLGLILARIAFSDFSEMQAFEIPVFAKIEVTQNNLFFGNNLIGKTLNDIQKELATK